MIILDTLLVGGIKFVLGKIVAAVDTELNDDTHLREELLAAQMRLELGEITEAEFAETERDLLDAIRAIRDRRERADEGPGDVRITGIEADLWDEQEEEDD
jgi:gas vesicle protein GvpG